MVGSVQEAVPTRTSPPPEILIGRLAAPSTADARAPAASKPGSCGSGSAAIEGGYRGQGAPRALTGGGADLRGAGLGARPGLLLVCSRRQGRHAIPGGSAHLRRDDRVAPPGRPGGAARAKREGGGVPPTCL